MLYNDAEVVIKIQHSGNFIFIVNKTHFLDDSLKLLEAQVIHLLGNQSMDNLLKVKPPKGQLKKDELD